MHLPVEKSPTAAATKLLTRLLGEQAIPSPAHSLERVLGRIELAIAALIQLRPDLPRLTRLAEECHRTLAHLSASEVGAHDTSRLQPPQRNTSFGAFGDFPHYSALTGVAPKEFDDIISLLLATALGPRILMRLEGLTLGAEQPPMQATPDNNRQIESDDRALMGALRRMPSPQLALGLQRWIKEHAPKDLEHLPLPTGPEELRATCRAIQRGVREISLLRVTAPLAISPADQFSMVERVDPDRMASEAAQGCAPEDCGASRQRQVVFGQPGEHDATLQAARGLVAHGMAAAHAPSSLRWVPQGQVAPLAQALAQALARGGPSRAGSHGLLQLAAITTVAPAALMDAPLLGHLDTLDAKRATRLHFRRSEGRLLVVVPRGVLPESYEQPEDAIGQHRYLGATVLGLPRALSDWLSEAIEIEGDTIRYHYPDAMDQLDKTRLALGNQLTLSLSEGRLRNLLAAPALRTIRSTCMAARALPAASVLSGTLAYYLAHPMDEVYEAHRELLEQLYPGQTPPLSEAERGYLTAWTGCQLLPKVDAVREATEANIARVRAQLNATATDRQTLCAQFNALSRYTYTLLRMMTAARPVSDAFSLPQDVDAVLQMAQVSDKVLSPQTTTRLVPLTAQACEQVRHLRDAVDWMAREVVAQDRPDLAGKMLSTLPDAPGYPTLPPFFVLSCEGSTWDARGMDWAEERIGWGDAFAWPSNFNRALMAQYLSRRGVSDELIQSLLGHTVGTFTPGAPDSPLVMAWVHETLRPLQEALSRELGLAVLAWPHRQTGTGVHDLQPVVAAVPLFGDFDAERVRARELTARRKQHLSATLLAVERERLPPERILPRLQDMLRDRMKDEPASQLAEALGFVERLIGKKSASALERLFKSRERTRRLMHVAPCPTTHGRFELTQLRLAQTLREELVEAMMREAPLALEAGPDEALAWIALSALVAGAALAPDFLAFLAEALPNTHAHGPCLWLERTQGDQTQRWHADPLTAQWLYAFKQRWPDVPALDTERLHRQVAQRLHALPCLASMATAAESWQQARKALVAWYRYRLPGNLLAHATGERLSACLSREALAREAGLWVEHASSPPEGEATALPWASAPLPAGKCTRLAGSLKGLLCSVGLGPDEPRAKQLSQLQAEVAALMQGVDRDGRSDPRQVLLLGYLVQLLRDGGRVKRHLKERTIAAYLAPIRQLLLGPCGQNLLWLEPDELEALYRELLLTGSPKDRRRRLLSLRMFHDMLQSNYGMEPLRWNLVMQGITTAPSEVDANLVFDHEFERAMALLDAGWGGNLALCRAAKGVMCLMRYTGARFGEAYLRQVGDFTLGGYLRITPARGQGPLKTEASRREMPLRWVPEPALKVLQDFCGRPIERGAPGWLFADPAAQHDLLGRSRLARLIGEVLRAATGKPAIRAHHLRHTFITESYDRLVAPVAAGNGVQAACREERLGTLEPTRRAMAEWAVCNGHASPDTGHRVYLHHQERRVMRAAAELLPQDTVQQLALALGLPPAAADEASPIWVREPLAALDPWRGLPIGEAPAVERLLDLATPAPEPALSIRQVHEILAHPGKHWLPVDRFVELWGVPPAWVRALLPAEREVHESLPMTLGAKPRIEQGVLSRTGSRHRGSGRWPAGHRRIDLSRLEGLEATHANLGRAERLLRHASRNESAWTDLTEGDLRAVASWLRDIGIGEPWLEVEVPDDTREAWCAREPALRGIEVTVVPKRRQSRLRLARDSKASLRLAALHATQLWLIRARAIPRRA